MKRKVVIIVATLGSVEASVMSIVFLCLLVVVTATLDFTTSPVSYHTYRRQHGLCSSGGQRRCSIGCFCFCRFLHCAQAVMITSTSCRGRQVHGLRAKDSRCGKEVSWPKSGSFFHEVIIKPSTKSVTSSCRSKLQFQPHPTSPGLTFEFRG